MDLIKIPADYFIIIALHLWRICVPLSAIIVPAFVSHNIIVSFTVHFNTYLSHIICLLIAFSFIIPNVIWNIQINRSKLGILIAEDPKRKGNQGLVDFAFIVELAC